MAQATVHRVNIANFFFSPPKTMVVPNDTVRWVFQSGFLHTTTADLSSPKQWNSPNMSVPGDSFDVVFLSADGPGPFPYHCEIHALTMMDTIFVFSPCTRCGDADGNGTINISDVVSLIGYVFNGNPVPGDCNYPNGLGDADGNGTINISDAVALIGYVFNGVPVPHCQGM